MSAILWKQYSKHEQTQSVKGKRLRNSKYMIHVSILLDIQNNEYVENWRIK